MPPKRGKWAPPCASRGRGQPSSSRPFRPQSFTPTLPPSKEHASHGFSMRDEARNTASHRSEWAWLEGDAKLRHKPIAFISAGFVEPLKELKELERPESGEVTESVNDNPETNGNIDASAYPNAATPETEVLNRVTVETTVETTIRFIEQPRLNQSAVISKSVTAVGNGSSAAEEVEQVEKCEVEEITTAKETIQTDKEIQSNDGLFVFDLEGDESMLEKLTQAPPPKPPPAEKEKKTSSKPASPRASCGSDSSEEVILFKGRLAAAKGTSKRLDQSSTPEFSTFQKSSQDSKPSAEQKSSNARKTRALVVAPHNRTSQNDTLAFGMSRKKQLKGRRNSRHPPPMEEDSEEDAILADYIENMAANDEDDFFSQQLQALSGYRDLGGDHDSVNFGREDEFGLFKTGDSLGEDSGSEVSGASGTSDVETTDMLNEEKSESEEDESMAEDMDDETLAQLLAKQEEHGMGSDKLLLFNSSAAAKRDKGRQQKQHTTLPSASQVADALDNLEIGEWGAPYLRHPRKRRSKQPPNFNVSDSEVEAALRAAWQRDRERKKERKMAREALRSQGLLGKNADLNDLRVKYPHGMKLDDMKAELVSFLLSSAERLEFPPLDKHARKILHELANKFNITSKSSGSGDQRRPVFYRTKRTVRYASTKVEEATNHVDKAAMRIHRKYFHRVDIRGHKPSKLPSVTGESKARSSYKALILRDGEIVGASVPELGQDNKGRAMLEKMGWTKGMALGAADNKGILEPVAQVVKRSKAGLG